MLLFVNQVHYAILLYLYGSFLLGSLMFSLNIKQLPWNSCEVIILPNYIKFENHLLINPSESLTSRENSSRFTHWKRRSPFPMLSWSEHPLHLTFISIRLRCRRGILVVVAFIGFNSFFQTNNNQNYLGTCVSPLGTPCLAERFELTPVSSLEMLWTFLGQKQIKLGILPQFVNPVEIAHNLT